MSALTIFTDSRPSVAQIVNAFSGGGVNSDTVKAGSHKTLAAASLVANTLKTVLSIPSGRGTLNSAHAQTSNATTKSIRLKITIDGRVIFDATSSAATVSPAITGLGFPVVYSATEFRLHPQPVAFKSSLLIEVASSVTEATGINTLVNYEVNV